MSTLKNLFLLVMILSPVLSIAQQSGIEAALQKGNATELATFFSKSVDLLIPGTEDTFAATEAATVLSEFFTKQTVKGYKQNHVSTPQEGRAKYTIGDLYTAQGNYRVTLYYDAQQKISEIRIQK
ncbi:MAG: DUF4783 domain-containing protein [Saprospiraceae bacterium]|nr:DUF4783 domain-containing protein [Candidatus Opimibacter skivensis]